MEKNVKIRHIADAYKNPDRVMTLVTRLEEDETVSFAFAVNHPTEWVTTYCTSDMREQVKLKGDQFSKKKGREIALARLDCDRTRRAISIGEDRPYQAVLKYLVENETGVVQRIAADELEFMELFVYGVEELTDGE